MTGMDEQELVRLLNAPPTAAELADEAVYRDLFRRVGPTPGLAIVRPGAARTAVRRVGLTSTLAVAFAVAGAGVAAAYSSHLPAPVQSAVHRVLAPIGVPPAEPQRVIARPETEPAAPPSPEAPAPQPTPEPSPQVAPSATPEARPSASPSETPSADASASASGTPEATESPSSSVSASPSPTDAPTAPVALPTGSPSPTESPSPTTPTESPTPTTTPPPVPSTVTLGTAVGHKVAVGQTTVLSGEVADAAGAAVPDTVVVLEENEGQGWVQVSEARTTEAGAVSLATPAADRTASYRLTVGAVRSDPWRLVLKPTLTASARTAGTSATVVAKVQGGQPGSPVVLTTRRGGQPVVVGSGTLDAAGGVRFSFAAPTKQARYVVRVMPTDAHAGTRTQVVVAPAASTAASTASATPSAAVTPSP